MRRRQRDRRPSPPESEAVQPEDATSAAVAIGREATGLRKWLLRLRELPWTTAVAWSALIVSSVTYYSEYLSISRRATITMAELRPTEAGLTVRMVAQNLGNRDVIVLAPELIFVSPDSGQYPKQFLPAEPGRGPATGPIVVAGGRAAPIELTIDFDMKKAWRVALGEPASTTERRVLMWVIVKALDDRSTMYTHFVPLGDATLKQADNEVVQVVELEQQITTRELLEMGPGSMESTGHSWPRSPTPGLTILNPKPEP